MDGTTLAIIIAIISLVFVGLYTTERAIAKKRQAKQDQAEKEARQAANYRRHLQEREAIRMRFPNRDPETRTRTVKPIRDLKPGDLFIAAHGGGLMTLIATKKTSTYQRLRYGMEYMLFIDFSESQRKGHIDIESVYAHGPHSGDRFPIHNVKEDDEIITYVEK